MKLPGLSLEETEYLIPHGSILTGYVGSMSHGTYIPHTEDEGIDDKDIMTIYVSPLTNYIGVCNYGKKDRGTIQRDYNEWDSVAYDIRKYVHLLLKGNPNVNALLWLRESNLPRGKPRGF